MPFVVEPRVALLDATAATAASPNISFKYKIINGLIFSTKCDGPGGCTVAISIAPDKVRQSVWFG